MQDKNAASTLHRPITREVPHSPASPRPADAEPILANWNNFGNGRLTVCQRPGGVHEALIETLNDGYSMETGGYATPIVSGFGGTPAEAIQDAWSKYSNSACEEPTACDETPPADNRPIWALVRVPIPGAWEAPAPTQYPATVLHACRLRRTTAEALCSRLNATEFRKFVLIRHSGNGAHSYGVLRLPRSAKQRQRTRVADGLTWAEARRFAILMNENDIESDGRAIFWTFVVQRESVAMEGGAA